MKRCHDWIRQHFGLTTIHAVSKGPCPKPRIRSQACQNLRAATEMMLTPFVGSPTDTGSNAPKPAAEASFTKP